MPGGNPRYFDFGPTGCSRTHDAHRAAWQTPNDHVRQRHRVHLERDPALEQRASRGMALHCARQADAERLHRILQRTHARRAAQREPVSRSGPSPANHYRLGRRLQHEEATFIARLQNAGGLCRSSHRNWPSRSATRGLRALASCSHRANGRINCRGSNRRWMKVQWQVKVTQASSRLPVDTDQIKADFSELLKLTPEEMAVYPYPHHIARALVHNLGKPEDMDRFAKLDLNKLGRQLVSTT